jgi:predicted dehydrogenase/threonine dehydrogenase-like Zn-dependent dehydrogenase
MKQVLLSKGSAIVTDVPAPTIESGDILVQVRVSCLSVGTEMSSVKSTGIPIWKRALQQPDKIISTLNMAKTTGIKRTWSIIEEKRDAAHPTGYSATGVVIKVGSDITDIVPGDKVACAGAQCAYHAELIRVPRNLCTLLPETLGWEEASTVTLGAIAMQGVRRAQPTLGESFIVIGLGILGQLTVQLLRANGCRVIGMDLDQERVETAKKLGMDLSIHPDGGSDSEQVARLTDGFGADGVIITAATPSDSVMSSAFKMCRKKGRVVLVGDVGLNLNRADFYKNEIDFFISTSYGPGRYDNKYEEQGLDYPISYVRWTENRNMAEYLRLLADKHIEITSLISERYPVDEAVTAYEKLNSSSKKPMMVLLTYGDDSKLNHKMTLNPLALKTEGKIRVAVLGAGGFARASHLPNIQSLDKRFTLQAVVTRTGHSVMAIAKQFDAVYATTDYKDVLSDPDVDAVIIATRHNLHGSMVLEALQAGKHVLVEKPLTLTTDELNALDEFISNAAEDSCPVLLTGYNRRFSPYAQRIKEIISKRSGPFIINYRMNAGYIPLEHWVHGKGGGGRNLGEACHIYDLFTFLTNAEVSEVSAHSITPNAQYYSRTDNFIATLSFTDGSVASLTYTAMGNKNYSKELAEIYVDGKLLVMDDYNKLDVHGAKGQSLKTSIQEKGLKEELIAFADGINSGEWPIPWWQQRQTSSTALMVEEQIKPSVMDAEQ